MKLQLGFVILAGACAVGGCKPQTLSPEDFLYVYRCGSMPGEPTGSGGASYLGKDQTYQYITTTPNSPSEAFIRKDFAQRKLRCLAALLPEDFPEGFNSLTGEATFEAGDDTRQYVHDYLARNKKEGSSPAKSGDEESAKHREPTQDKEPAQDKEPSPDKEPAQDKEPPDTP